LKFARDKRGGWKEHACGDRLARNAIIMAAASVSSPTEASQAWYVMLKARCSRALKNSRKRCIPEALRARMLLPARILHSGGHATTAGHFQWKPAIFRSQRRTDPNPRSTVMKPTARTYIPTLLMCFTCAPLWAGTEGSSSTFYGSGAGANGSGSSGDNTFVGASAGNATSTGAFNVFVGEFAGLANALGSHNTAVGTQAGYSATGSGNVFLGDSAGVNEIGSNKLYIDNCLSPSCALPFIYGEFDNHLLNINGVTNVAANNAPISQLHFSIANADSGGWLTSVLQNNFFVSSGARYDGTQPAGHNWVQRSIDGRAVSAGSGSVGYRIFTSKGHSVGDTFDITDSTRLFINYDGEFGINGAPVAGHEIPLKRTSASLQKMYLNWSRARTARALLRWTSSRY
jgi:hypothetical protein